MESVPLKNVVGSGVWYECSGKYCDEVLPFRLMVLGLSPTTLEGIDESLCDEVEIEGVLWLMTVSVVSFAKAPIGPWKISSLLVLIDDDGFQFEPFTNSSLTRNKRSGLRRFANWSDNPPLSPKIAAAGSIAFVLPNEETAYSLSIKGGDIHAA